MFDGLRKILGLDTGSTQKLPSRPYVNPQPRQASDQQLPEITYNPNPNTNIPYSAHSVEEAQLGNRYTQNPTSPEFLGVDPARFGYPEDRAVRPRNSLNVMQPFEEILKRLR